jgi:murein DD-endopeptidase MepM/ murein hydrolase activator NlpD
MRVHLLVWVAAVLGLISAAAASESSYVVKRGDTLTSIARKSGVSVTALAERNGLGKNHYVTAGQRLTIPGKPKSETPNETKPESQPAAAPAASSTALPKSVSDALSNASVRAGRWKYIVIHHSAVDEGTMKGMDDYHRKQRHMEHGLAYHFVIGNGNGMRDGEIGVGNRWKQQLDGGHLRSESQNKVALGICLVGNFDKHPPTARQMQSLNALVRALMKRCGMSAKGVRTHQQINIIGTRCPGSRFPSRSFINGLKQSN